MDKQIWFGCAFLFVSVSAQIYIMVTSMSEQRKKVLSTITVIFFVVGVVMIAVGVFGLGPSGENPASTITQSSTGPNSPNVVGDGNQFFSGPEQHPWELTDDQKKKLTVALNKVPPGTIYKLRISFIADCDQCARYAHDLGETWYEIPGWEVQVADLYGLSIRLQGVFVITDIEGCPPEALALAMEALDAALIAYVKDQTGKIGSDSCAVIVANKPRE